MIFEYIYFLSALKNTAYLNSLMKKEFNFANQKMGIEIKFLSHSCMLSIQLQKRVLSLDKRNSRIELE